MWPRTRRQEAASAYCPPHDLDEPPTTHCSQIKQQPRAIPVCAACRKVLARLGSRQFVLQAGAAGVRCAWRFCGGDMERRKVLKVMGGAELLSSWSASAQPADQMRRIALISQGAPFDATTPNGKALLAGLAQRGYTPGKN